MQHVCSTYAVYERYMLNVFITLPYIHMQYIHCTHICTTYTSHKQYIHVGLCGIYMYSVYAIYTGIHRIICNIIRSRWCNGLACLQQWPCYLQGSGFKSHLRSMKFFACNKVSSLNNQTLTSVSCAPIIQLKSYQGHNVKQQKCGHFVSTNDLKSAELLRFTAFYRIDNVFYLSKL